MSAISANPHEATCIRCLRDVLIMRMSDVDNEMDMCARCLREMADALEDPRTVDAVAEQKTRLRLTSTELKATYSSRYQRAWEQGAQGITSDVHLQHLGHVRDGRVLCGQALSRHRVVYTGDTNVPSITCQRCLAVARGEIAEAGKTTQNT